MLWFAATEPAWSCQAAPVTVLLAARVVALRDRSVLLTRRADFEVWCLPGGMMEQGESMEDAARRELREEAGTVVGFDRFVGVYSELGGWCDVHIGVFLATGPLDPSPLTPEVVALEWFDVDRLPEDRFWWQDRYIRDAVEGSPNLGAYQDSKHLHWHIVSGDRVSAR
jgi:8-oxo-dGTP pyrophosphatase MutT (NUDIX family)